MDFQWSSSTNISKVFRVFSSFWCIPMCTKYTKKRWDATWNIVWPHRIEPLKKSSTIRIEISHMGMQLVTNPLVLWFRGYYPIHPCIPSWYWWMVACMDGRSGSRWKVKTCMPYTILYVREVTLHPILPLGATTLVLFSLGSLVKLRGNWSCLIIKVRLWSKWEQRAHSMYFSSGTISRKRIPA